MHPPIAYLLILSASLKIWELLTRPGLTLQLDVTRYLLTLVVTGELGLGLLLLTGSYRRQLRFIAMSLFSAFAAYSLYLAITGAASCGCFGPVNVSPWWTFTLDMLIVAGLVVEWWWERKLRRTSPSSTLSPVCLRRMREGRAVLAAFGGMCCLVFLTLVWKTQPEVDSANPLLHTVGKLVVLEPEDWVGHRFPLADSIDVDLSQGEWLVVLHRHDCGSCHESLPRYEELARTSRDLRIVKVEVPPYGPDGETVADVFTAGRLSDEREWFVQTPVELRLKDGVVVHASRELPAVKGEESPGNDYVTF